MPKHRTSLPTNRAANPREPEGPPYIGTVAFALIHVGLHLGRTSGAAVAKSLGLSAKAPRQNGSISAGKAQGAKARSAPFFSTGDARRHRRVVFACPRRLRFAGFLLGACDSPSSSRPPAQTLRRFRPALRSRVGSDQQRSSRPWRIAAARLHHSNLCSVSLKSRIGAVSEA